MALQSSGAISLADIASEFGGSTPHSLSEYYRGGGLVSSNNTSVPTSGTISLSQFYGAVSTFIMTVSSNQTNYNLLSAAQAAGYDNSTGQPITINISAGVSISGSGASAVAMTTGAFHQNAVVTINIASGATVTGANGATGADFSGTGGAGGAAISVTTSTGGSGSVSIVNSGTIRGGGGGGGGRGNRGIAYGLDPDSLESPTGVTCSTLPAHYDYGSYGSVGSAGSYGSAGTSGTAGTNPAENENCGYYQTATGGGSGGAGGYSVAKNGRTVSTSGGGTYTGTIG